MSDKVVFQILDADYIHYNNKPLIRLFGRTDANESITVFYDKMLPYFYILPHEGHQQALLDEIKNTYGDLVLKIVTVKKFLPVGYSKEPTELIKIIMCDPSKTPFIRDGLKDKPFTKQVFEADILFKYRFMSDYGLRGMCWYEATGIHWQNIDVKTSIKFKADSFKEVDKQENMDFKYISFDIETLMSKDETGIPDPEKNPIIMVSMNFKPAHKGKETLILAAKPIPGFIADDAPDIRGFANEREMLREFLKVVDEFDPDIILGYNIAGFDWPYVSSRLKSLALPTTLGRCRQKKMRVASFGGRTRVTIPGRVSLDMYGLVKEAANKFGLFKGIKRYGLGDVSALVLGETKVDVAHSEITGHWHDNGEKLSKLLNYSRKDAELPMQILFKKNMFDKFIEICKVSGIIPQDCVDSGETVRIDSILFREFNKRNFVMPCKPDDAELSKRATERKEKGLEGAFVLDPVIGFHDKCIGYLDYKCHPSGTEVIVKGIGKTKIEDVRRGDFVFGKNGWHKVKKLWSYDYDGDLIDVNGLRCTPNHRLPTMIHAVRQRKMYDALSSEMFKGTVKGKIIKCADFDKISNDERRNITEKDILRGELIGALLAEGSFIRRDQKYFDNSRKKERISHQYRVEATINQFNSDFQKRFKYIFRKLWEIDTFEQKSLGAVRISCARKHIFKIVSELMKDRESLDSASIVRGFFEGDGYINKVRRTLVMNQSEVNLWKIDFIISLLDKLGIAYKRYCYHYNYQKNPMHVVEISKKEDIIKYSMIVGAISCEKKEGLGEIIDKKFFTNCIARGGFFFEEKIRSRKVKYKGRVHDLTLDGKPYYFANGILTHNSMYPNIVISFNICPTTYVNGSSDGLDLNVTPYGSKFVKTDVRVGILPQILDYLLKTRSAIKKQMKATTDPAIKNYYYAKQYAFKTIANAMYGYSGYMRSRVYVLDIANGITSVGRETTLKTRDIVHAKTSFKVVYGDTDSVQVKFDTNNLEEAFKLGKEVSDIINEEIGNILEIKIDSIFKSAIYLAKKRYAAWNFEPMKKGWDEEILTKGIETVRRDWCDLVSDTLNNVLEIILKEQDTKKAVDFARQTIQDVRDGKIDIDKLIMTKSVSRSPKAYKGIQPHIELMKKMRRRDPATAPGIGDRVGYVITRGAQMTSKRAEDPEYIKANNIRIDSDYYINNQLLPPLERVFESLGVRKADLVGKGRQLGLFDCIGGK